MHTGDEAPRPPLTRSRDDRIIAGVCAGLAEHLGLPTLWVRIGMAVFALAAGAGGLLYIFLLLAVPEEGESPEVTPLRRVFTPPNERETSVNNDAPVSATPGEPAAHTPRRNLPIAEIMLGGVFLIAGGALVLDQMGVSLRLGVILPGLAVLVGVGLTWWLITDRDRPERHQIPRILGALALVAVGVLMFFVTAREPSVLTVVGAALAVLAGVALAVAPWLLRLNRQLVAERAARAREAERAEIAAHLHDSVLQTLALIQQRSEPGTEVARLARGQERELREWLFRTADDASGPQLDTAEAELVSHAAALEAAHPVRFEVVVVGERIVAPSAIIASAREAMLNAARHAGGEVTVYLETTPDTVRIEVNDRGPGFDPEQITDQRLGVRESIFGRMERAGATAKIVPGPGGQGTSVRLEHPRTPSETTPDHAQTDRAEQP